MSGRPNATEPNQAPQRRTLATLVLQALPEAGACVTVPQIAEATGIERRDVTKALDVLHRRKLAIRQRPGCFLVTAAGVAARDGGTTITCGPKGRHTGRRKAVRQTTLRDKAWRTMRSLVVFTLGDLIELADTETRDPEGNLGRYVRALVAAGFVAELRRREPGTAPTSNGAKRYRLMRDDGPQTPRISRGELWDPNTETAYPLDGGEVRR
jgi:hypothetical protein